MDQNRADTNTMLWIAFLWACATAGPFSVLALILRQNGLDPHSIAYIMASSQVAMFVGTLVSGTLTARYGPLRVAMIAVPCTAIAVLSFEWTTADPIAAILSRLLQGFGFGMMMPAGLSYVQNKAPENDVPRALALYSVMSVATYVFAQWEAEFYLDKFGARGIFAIHSIMFLFVLALVLYLAPREPKVKEKPKGASYRAVLSVPLVYVPFFCMFVNGMLFGFGASFMAIMLKDAGVRLGFYFMSFAIVTLFGRFSLMKLDLFRNRIPRPILLAIGMGVSGIGCFFPLVSLSIASIVISGALYGFGYTFIGPMSITLAGQPFTPAERPRPTALTQTFFQGGSILSPLIAGYGLAAMGWFALPLLLSAIGIASLTMALSMLVFSEPVPARKRA